MVSVRCVCIRGIALLIVLSISACISPANLPGPPPTPLPAGAAKEREQGLSSPPGLSGSFYTTLAEVRKQPALFEGQKVRLRGKVVEIQGATFKLTDDASNMVKVVTVEPVAVQPGEEVTVAGKLTVTRVSDARSPLFELQDAHILFTPTAGKVTAKPAATPPADRLRASPPLVSPVPSLPAEKDEGQVF